MTADALPPCPPSPTSTQCSSATQRSRHSTLPGSRPLSRTFPPLWSPLTPLVGVLQTTYFSNGTTPYQDMITKDDNSAGLNYDRTSSIACSTCRGEGEGYASSPQTSMVDTITISCIQLGSSGSSSPTLKRPVREGFSGGANEEAKGKRELEFIKGAARLVNPLFDSAGSAGFQAPARHPVTDQLGLVNYLSWQHTMGSMKDRLQANQALEEHRRSMLVLDVFVTEDRSLRAWALGPAAHLPLYIFYPANHPFDALLIRDIDLSTPEISEVNISPVSLFYQRTTSTLRRLRKSPLINSPTSSSHGRAQTWSSMSKKTPLPVCQSILQLRNPLEPGKVETIAGIRWSTSWLNRRLACVPEEAPNPDPLPIIPRALTQEELQAIFALNEEREKRAAELEKMDPVKRWWRQVTGKEQQLTQAERRVAEASARAIADQDIPADARARLHNRNILKVHQDAGAVFLEPLIVPSTDPCVVGYLPPLSKPTKRTSGGRSGPAAEPSKKQTFATLPRSWKATAAKASPYPVLRSEAKPHATLSYARKMITALDLHQQLAEHVNSSSRPVSVISAITSSPPSPRTSSTNGEEGHLSPTYVIADEFKTLDPQTPVAEMAGYRVWYEPPRPLTKEEKQALGVKYVSGKYMWAFDGSSWVITYERRASMEVAANSSKVGKGGGFMSVLQELGGLFGESKKQEKKKMGCCVKLYPPASSCVTDLLALLDLEVGQMYVRRDTQFESLHLVVLAMFSVVNLEEMIAKEQKRLKRRMQKLRK